MDNSLLDWCSVVLYAKTTCDKQDGQSVFFLSRECTQQIVHCSIELLTLTIPLRPIC